MITLSLKLHGKEIAQIQSPTVPRVGEFLSLPAGGDRVGFVAYEVQEINYQVTEENTVNAILVDLEPL